ncbi:class I SAM-dependent methyltransferase [Rhodopila sp.]|uniref:SAM-dependent methyltransferase n=1 Tax=Rhodopila sp. TaxID=2480087 RepID=UPI003D1519FA
MIFPKQPQTTAAVAAHYDELDRFYREIWGEHVHHGYWTTGRETPTEAAEALVALLAAKLHVMPGNRVCDIGCGYGASGQYLAERHGADVIGVTVSATQADCARGRVAARGTIQFLRQDWLVNGFAAASFDHALAIESSEHMPDKQRFFDQAFRTLKPGGLFTVCAWLAADNPRAWEVRHLLEPICREGRLPSMGNEADYRRMGEQAGFQLVEVEELSDRVRRTWSICTQRMLVGLVTRPGYLRFLLDRTAINRMFAITLLRILIAYRTRSMRYCLLVFRRPAA